MHILVLGGTVFLGRHVVESATARGHQVTLFNRGRSGSDLFPKLETLRGDRDGDLGALRGRRFDAVVDTSGYVPRLVSDSARLLADACANYVFVSSLSVYADVKQPGEDETAAVAQLADEGVEEVTGETYGGLKALCERAAERALPGRVLNLRPGLIVGPCDPTDRFTYWPLRVARGGPVLAPAPPDWTVEFTDVRDLATFIVHAIETRLTGTLNASGPSAQKTSLGALLDACRDVSGSDATLVWIPLDWLQTRGVGVWMDLPLRVGSDAPGFSTRSTRRACEAGLRFRPMEETIRATLEWAKQRGNDALAAGLSPERERDLLSAWRAES